MTVDAVVLDVDGVLVDVSDSYRRAVVESVERVHGRTIQRADLQSFKDAGGFNDDWDLTYAVALYVLATGEGYHESVETYTDGIAERGGGLDAARKTLRAGIGAQATQRVLDGWERERLRDVFQALYLGTDLYRALEGGEPPIETDGFIHDEDVLVDPATLDRLTERYDVGVLTGRPAAEAAIALDRVGLSVPPAHQFTMDDWEGGKPEPDALIELADRLEASSVAYVGDTLDDVRTVNNAQATDGDRRYVAVGVLTGGLTGESGREAFDAVGADGVASSINDVEGVLEPIG